MNLRRHKMRTFDIIRLSAVSGAAAAILLAPRSVRTCLYQLLELLVEKCCAEIVKKVSIYIFIALELHLRSNRQNCIRDGIGQNEYF